MTTFTSEDREMAAKHDGIESPHNACCYKDKCRQQQADKQVSLEIIKCHEQTISQKQAEIELLETEILVKGAFLKSYKEALEQIATGGIAGESTNYKDTAYVMRQIASDALAILRKAQEVNPT